MVSPPTNSPSVHEQSVGDVCTSLYLMLIVLILPTRLNARQHIRNIGGTEESYEFSGDVAYVDPASRPSRRQEISNIVFDKGSTTYISSVSPQFLWYQALNGDIRMVMGRRRQRAMAHSFDLSPFFLLYI